MKKTIKALGIIALAALIAFSFAACPDGSGSPDETGGTGGSSGSEPGGLTIIGLPSSDGGWMAYLFPPGTDISTPFAINYVMDSSDLSDRIVASSGAVRNGNNLRIQVMPSRRAWTGSGSFPVVLYESYLGDYYRGTVNFSNGTATVQFSSFTYSHYVNDDSYR
jgi:hypothetical protein